MRFTLPLGSVDEGSLHGLADYRNPSRPGYFADPNRAPALGETRSATDTATEPDPRSLLWSGSERAAPIVEGARADAVVGVRLD